MYNNNFDFIPNSLHDLETILPLCCVTYIQKQKITTQKHQLFLNRLSMKQFLECCFEIELSSFFFTIQKKCFDFTFSLQKEKCTLFSCNQVPVSSIFLRGRFMFSLRREILFTKANLFRSREKPYISKWRFFFHFEVIIYIAKKHKLFCIDEVKFTENYYWHSYSKRQLFKGQRTCCCELFSTQSV